MIWQERVLLGGANVHLAEQHFANQLNNFASIYLGMGDLVQAEKMYEEALDITLQLCVYIIIVWPV